MSFQDFFNTLKQKADELKTEALKFKNREFLNAAVGGSVLIAMADGTISSEEKQKMMRFIENYEPLSVFSSKELIETFQNTVSQIEFDRDLGEARVFEALGKMKNNTDASRLIMRLIICIACSDGTFDEKEQYVARKIAGELNLNPSDFELG
ncbi:Tellurite resistance TerB [Candidatus Woesearchaeota archaeon]|jgi:tellurite resistance protein TerB|nr:Tellurite resistance TerB [Candidatus Woesearchaeota archaeon]